MIGQRLITAARGLIQRAAEGAYRPGPYYLPKSGGVLSAEAGAYANFWQLGYNTEGGTHSAIVHACIAAYAQTVAMCPGDHWRATDKGGRERVTNSALSRMLRRPNDYQSISDFMLNLVWELYATGNSYCLALRNDRYEVDELHLMKASVSKPVLGPDGDVFYRLGGNDVISWRLSSKANSNLMVPARDVLHLRLNADMQSPWPLIGDTPLSALYSELATQGSIMNSQGNFYANQGRPSAVLSTDLVLDKDQVQALRDRWDDQARGLRSGGTPILTAGLKVTPWNVSSRDAQMAEFLKMTQESVALAYRIPLQILGLGGGAPMGSTEVLMNSWIASGLGFALNHIEEGFGQFFRLKGQPDEYVEFSTEALLRSQFKDRIDALVKGVQGGIFSPNDARNMEGLDSVPFGDEPRVQQQVVPLSAVDKIPAPPSPAAPPPAPAPDGEPLEGDPDAAAADTKVFVDLNRVRALTRERRRRPAA